MAGAKPTTLASVADQLIRFTFDELPIRGQWVRLERVLADANAHHNYPLPIKSLLAEQLAAVAMFADTLKMNGSVALQSRGEGRLIRSLAECREQENLRAIAHLREQVEDQASVPQAAHLNDWLGSGQLALTLIPELHSAQTYQGMIELAHPDLEGNLEHYFHQSEQLPTRLFFAHSPTATTGLLLQRLPDDDLGHEIASQTWEDAWETIQVLIATLTLEELAALPPEQFLRRFFSEFPCRLHPPRHLRYQCTCTRTKTDNTLRAFAQEELQEILTERGSIDVDCEFCGARYTYDAVDVAALERDGTTGSKTVH
ncbi:MAG: redox-regulated molecular chaperone Hsp33 [Pseudomonadales bacterium]|nr:redox-regulated molecular chaperone Hsp33 [Pseudomonadales bacterium]